MELNKKQIQIVNKIFHNQDFRVFCSDHNDIFNGTSSAKYNYVISNYLIFTKINAANLFSVRQNDIIFGLSYYNNGFHVIKKSIDQNLYTFINNNEQLLYAMHVNNVGFYIVKELLTRGRVAFLRDIINKSRGIKKSYFKREKIVF